ncbi:foldase protein PrsA [Peribacillus deserti]|uniref:Foldase protein PrsA n=1 Tax=Peribacillus deserti TaxID=673318 RepID=A0ABS2QCX9_9BACI|nr:peptidylprolyl isomerase [Peribacillus deserti]MBM7691022.1 foldase protein PrsA [Peribacillus deserti]
MKMIGRGAGRKMLLTVVMGGVVAFGAGCSDSEKAATVNGEEITKQEVYNKLYEQNGSAMLDSLITEKIVNLESAKKKVKVSDKEVDEEVKKLQESYGGEDALTQQLTSAGLTLDDVKSDLTVNLKIKKLMEPDIKITEKEMKEYFETNKASYAVAEQVKASHILVETKAKADEVKKKLDAGESFKDLAKEYSTEDATKDKGGDLGYFAKGEMTAAFEKAAFSMKEGEVSDPVKTEFGYHIIKVVDKKAAKPAVYEENKKAIKAAIIDQKTQDTYSDWMEKTKEKYKVKNYLEKES